VPGTPRRVDAVPREPRRPMEHLALPLPQSRCRVRARALRLRGAGRRAARAARATRAPRLRLDGRDGQPCGAALSAVTKRTRGDRKGETRASSLRAPTGIGARPGRRGPPSGRPHGAGLEIALAATLHDTTGALR